VSVITEIPFVISVIFLWLASIAPMALRNEYDVLFLALILPPLHCINDQVDLVIFQFWDVAD